MSKESDVQLLIRFDECLHLLFSVLFSELVRYAGVGQVQERGNKTTNIANSQLSPQENTGMNKNFFLTLGTLKQPLDKN